MGVVVFGFLAEVLERSRTSGCLARGESVVVVWNYLWSYGVDINQLVVCEAVKLGGMYGHGRLYEERCYLIGS